MSNKYNTFRSSTQDRTGNGQFSTKKHVATVSELNDKAQRQAEADKANKAVVAALGLDVEYSDIFAV